MITSNATRDDLIDLGHRLLGAKTEEETEKLYAEFNYHFSHPDAANLFYWPEGYDFRNDTGI